jgi:hypothetical protein
MYAQGYQANHGISKRCHACFARGLLQKTEAFQWRVSLYSYRDRKFGELCQQSVMIMALHASTHLFSRCRTIPAVHTHCIFSIMTNDASFLYCGSSTHMRQWKYEMRWFGTRLGSYIWIGDSHVGLIGPWTI